MPWAPIWTDSVWGGGRCGAFGVGGALLGGACIELSRLPAVSYESDRSMSSPSRLTEGTPWGGVLCSCSRTVRLRGTVGGTVGEGEFR